MNKQSWMVMFAMICLLLTPVATIAATAEITLEQAIHEIIENNLSSKTLGYKVKQADSAYERSQTKFSPFVNMSSGFQNVILDPASLDAVYGSQFYKAQTGLSLGQSFKTGTTVIGGYQETYTDYSVPGAYLTGRPTSWHSPAIFVQIKRAHKI